MARKPKETMRLIQLGFPCKITNDKHDINLMNSEGRVAIIRRSKVSKKERERKNKFYKWIKTKHKADKGGWREMKKLGKKVFFSFFLKVDS